MTVRVKERIEGVHLGQSEPPITAIISLDSK